jgi:hypothetical protein
MPLSFTFLGALQESATNLWAQSTGILKQLGQSIFGTGSNVQLGGVVEITRQLSKAASQGLRQLFVHLAGIILILGLMLILTVNDVIRLYSGT